MCSVLVFCSVEVPLIKTEVKPASSANGLGYGNKSLDDVGFLSRGPQRRLSKVVVHVREKNNREVEMN